MSEEDKNFEPDGIVNAYEYNRTDKDGVNEISKRREIRTDCVTSGIVDSKRLTWLRDEEVILTPEQVKLFEELINNLPKIDLSKFKLQDIQLGKIKDTIEIDSPTNEEYKIQSEITNKKMMEEFKGLYKYE